jgi:hypothetical protein
MMLNWKDMVLGYHARIIVVGRHNSLNPTSDWAQVDARVLGVDLKVSAFGPLWPSLRPGLPAAEDPVLGIYIATHYNSTRQAMEGFEVFVKALQNEYDVQEEKL